MVLAGAQPLRLLQRFRENREFDPSTGDAPPWVVAASVFLGAVVLVVPRSMPAVLASRPTSSADPGSGPDVFLGDRAVAPLGNGDHAAAAFELADDTGPLARPERDRVGRDLGRRAPH